MPDASLHVVLHTKSSRMCSKFRAAACSPRRCFALFGEDPAEETSPRKLLPREVPSERREGPKAWTRAPACHTELVGAPKRLTWSPRPIHASLYTNAKIVIRSRRPLSMACARTCAPPVCLALRACAGVRRAPAAAVLARRPEAARPCAPPCRRPSVRMRAASSAAVCAPPRRAGCWRIGGTFGEALERCLGLGGVWRGIGRGKRSAGRALEGCLQGLRRALEGLCRDLWRGLGQGGALGCHEGTLDGELVAVWRRRRTGRGSLAWTDHGGELGGCKGRGPWRDSGRELGGVGEISNVGKGSLRSATRPHRARREPAAATDRPGSAPQTHLLGDAVHAMHWRA